MERCVNRFFFIFVASALLQNVSCSTRSVRWFEFSRSSIIVPDPSMLEPYYYALLYYSTEYTQVCVVDAERALVKALMAVEDVALIGVWVSLDSIEAIEDRIRTTLISRGAVKESPDFESEVRGRVRQSVNDIEFGVMSGVFDFTVINNSDEEESMETVRRAVEFATG